MSEASDKVNFSKDPTQSMFSWTLYQSCTWILANHKNLERNNFLSYKYKSLCYSRLRYIITYVVLLNADSTRCSIQQLDAPLNIMHRCQFA